MQQWNGLLKKEWVTMKWPMTVSALLVFSVMLFVPILTAGNEVPIFEASLMICFIWAGASILVPVIMLLTMLERDMKWPDIWLHSTASIFKLMGSKVFIAVLVGIGSLLIPTAVVALQYVFVGTEIFSFYELLYFGSLFVCMIFVGSLFVMITGFFFWVIHQLLKPTVKGFSIPLTLVLFFISSALYGKMADLAVYRKIVQLGLVDLSNLDIPGFEMEFIFFERTSSQFYIGELAFDIVFTLALFVVATVLFEKKVRL